MLRVVSGSGGGTGGTAAVSSPAHSITGAAHTLVTSEMPAHAHATTGHATSSAGGSTVNPAYGYSGYGAGTWTGGSAGGGGSHSHSLSGAITTPAYMDVIIATKD